MQKCGLKIVTLVLALCGTLPLHAQTPEAQLKEADSLFARKLYTQSLQKYTALFEQNTYSPAMLLRMSRIEEGLGHTARSLYYLNLNYLATRDERVLAKMEEVASKNRLDGYEISSADKLSGWLTVYHTPVQLTLAALAMLLFTLVLYYKRKMSVRPAGTFALFIVTLTLLLIVTNYSARDPKGILTQAPVYLMSGPSSGANVITILNPGHRVEVKGKHDVWLRIVWNEKEAFVKESQLLPVQL